MTRLGTSRTDYFFFFNDTATTEIYTLSLHDALPIWPAHRRSSSRWRCRCACSSPPAWPCCCTARSAAPRPTARSPSRSEEHTSELQSRQYLVCRLLLEKKKPGTSL